MNGGGGERKANAFMSSSLGFVPSLFGLQAGADGTVQMQLLGELSPEQAQRAFLSRALLLLAPSSSSASSLLKSSARARPAAGAQLFSA